MVAGEAAITVWFVGNFVTTHSNIVDFASDDDETATSIFFLILRLVLTPKNSGGGHDNFLKGFNP